MKGKESTEEIQNTKWGLFWWTLATAVHVGAVAALVYFTPLRQWFFGQTDPDQLTPEEEMVERDFSGYVESLLHMLDEREEDILRKYYGFDDQEPMTLEAIGQQMGVTRERVRQLRNVAINKLKAKQGVLV